MYYNGSSSWDLDEVTQIINPFSEGQIMSMDMVFVNGFVIIIFYFSSIVSFSAFVMPGFLFEFIKASQKIFVDDVCDNSWRCGHFFIWRFH